jgi:hypothetical protein
MKRIERKKFYHTMTNHKRELSLKFGADPPQLCLKNAETMAAQVKTWPLKNVRAVFNRDSGQEHESVQWRYMFDVVMIYRTFTFYSVNEEQRKHWIKIFSLIAAMNKNEIPVSRFNPFDVMERVL